MKRILSLLLIITVAACCLVGCGQETIVSDGYKAYYITKDGSSIVDEAVEMDAVDTDGIIKELLEKLHTDAESVDYRQAIAQEIEVTNYYVEDAELSLYFNEEYAKMDSMTEVLCRAAVVYTLLQVPDIEKISFYVNGEPLADASGTLVGAMTKDSFVQNPGEQINSIQDTVLTLYFASLSGEELLKESQEVHYSSNISMDKLVVERLLVGPLSDYAQGTIPSGTQILSVTTVDGVCYVNFDDTFMNQNYEISEEVVIYSIVDSLLELSGVEKVQISVNGDTGRTYRDKLSFSTLYEGDYSLVAGTVTQFEENDTQKEPNESE